MKRPTLLRLLAVFLRADDSDEIVGDLQENFALRSDKRGSLNAQLWLARQVFALPLWLLMERLETRGLPSQAAQNQSGDSFMRSRSQDIRFALRSFVRTPGFSLVTILTLSLGIAANTAIFSVVDGVLLEGLPYEDPDQLMFMWHTAPGVGIEQIGSARGFHIGYEEVGTHLQGIASYREGSANVTGQGDPPRAETVEMTASLFDVLGVQPTLGRGFTREEDLPEGPAVVVLSHGMWATRFASDPGVLGRTMEVNGLTHEILGVMPEGFGFPSPTTQLFSPIRIDPFATSFGGFNIMTIGRLAGDVTPEELQSQLLQGLPRIAERFEDLSLEMLESTKMEPRVTPLMEMMVGPVSSALWVVMGTVGLVLLIACANVGNLFLARAEARQKEVAIRTAMGAGRRDLFWQYSTESVILGVSSGLLGIVLAFGGLKILVANAPQNIPRISEIGIDGSVLAFTALISLAAAFFFGAIPMLRHTLVQPGTALRDGSRGSTAGKNRNRGRQFLVASQVAFALVLLVGSGLMLRSFEKLLKVELGFDEQDVATFRLILPGQTYPDVGAVARFHREALQRIRAIPGVTGAAAVSLLPLSGNDWSGDPLYREDAPMAPNEIPPVIALKAVSPSYFETMGIPLLKGRELLQADIEAFEVTASKLSR